MRKRLERKNHVWAYDFPKGRTHDGRSSRMLVIVDKWSRECGGVPQDVWSDTGSEFTAGMVRNRVGKVGVRTPYIQRGSPWENGLVESFNGQLRDELLKGEIFYTLREAEVLVKRWRKHYNTTRPHSSLVYKPPMPEAVQMGGTTRSERNQGVGVGR